MVHSAAKKQDFFSLLTRGHSIVEASRKIGIHKDTGYDWVAKKESGAFAYLEQKAIDALPSPKLRSELREEALIALDDFDYWRFRYMGRRSRPWQVEAAHRTVEWLLSDNTELVVVNLPPGAGKSTLFTCDIPLWLLCRQRSIREFLGHRTIKEAEKYARRMRRALERTQPLPPDPAQGRHDQAEGCLAQDYGRFQPRNGDVWRADEFTVLAEFDGIESIIEDKEATVTAKGMGTEFLGMRSEFVVWDDLVTQKILNSPDAIEQQRIWWDNEAVTRVEPGGCLLLVGQRMGPNDLYQYVLDERTPPEDADEAFVDTLQEDEYAEWLANVGTSRYRHIVFPAHFEDRCTGDHGTPTTYNDPKYAYPDGCLLDPVRLPWSKGANSLRNIAANGMSKYLVQYQQENSDPGTTLVQRLWIEGGIDKEGNVYPGCLDKYRGLCELPKGLSMPVVSVATVDPSPTQYWSIQWWIYHPASESRYLMDLKRVKMGANDWLDWNENTKEFYGVAEDWQLRSRELGLPISHWVFEQNAAQRFVLQFSHFKRWQRKHGVQITAHNTTVRKLDDEFGVQMLADRYRFGNVRLPYLRAGSSFLSPAKVASDHLIREVTTYPEAVTTDCLMAQYFFEYTLPQIAAAVLPSNKPRGRLRRPSWAA